MVVHRTLCLGNLFSPLPVATRDIDNNRVGDQHGKRRPCNGHRVECCGCTRLRSGRQAGCRSQLFVFGGLFADVDRHQQRGNGEHGPVSLMSTVSSALPGLTCCSSCTVDRINMRCVDYTTDECKRQAKRKIHHGNRTSYDRRWTVSNFDISSSATSCMYRKRKWH